jgi:hypothetical protein
MSAFETSATELSLVDETALDDPVCREQDLVFTKEQWGNLDYQYKRRLAAAAESDEVGGKTDAVVVSCFFIRQHTISDFTD